MIDTYAGEGSIGEVTVELGRKYIGVEIDQQAYKIMKKNPDGSIPIFVGPKAPNGMENNWIKTIPNRG